MVLDEHHQLISIYDGARGAPLSFVVATFTAENATTWLVDPGRTVYRCGRYDRDRRAAW
jgi:hypothetical protein